MVETALGVDDGFWGARACGATCRGVELVAPGRHRCSGTKVPRRGGDVVTDAAAARPSAGTGVALGAGTAVSAG